MAETALAVFGLLGLFSTAVEGFQYVHIAKQYDRDYKTAQLNLDATCARLRRWGRDVNINQRSPVALSEEDYCIAEGILEHVISLIQEAAIKAERRAKMKGTAGSTAETYVASHELAPAQRFVHTSLAKRTQEYSPYAKVGTWEKFKWAIYKKKDLNSLIGDITESVEHLERLVPIQQEQISLETPVLSREEALQRIVNVEVEEIENEALRGQGNDIDSPNVIEVVGALQEAASQTNDCELEIDPRLMKAVAKRLAELQPTQVAGDYVSVTQTNRNIKNNTGIVTAFMKGNYTYNAAPTAGRD